FARASALCETNIVPRNSEHHLFGIRVFHFVCNSALFLCAIALVFGVIDKGYRREILTSVSDQVMCLQAVSAFLYVNNINVFPTALGNSATIAGVVRKLLLAQLELLLCLASFRGMMDVVFKPSLRLARDVTVRTLDDAAEFARTYVGPPLPHRRDRVVHRLEEISDEASAR